MIKGVRKRGNSRRPRAPIRIGKHRSISIPGDGCLEQPYRRPGQGVMTTLASSSKPPGRGRSHMYSGSLGFVGGLNRC